MSPSDVQNMRKLARLNQYELARESGIERARLSLFENGHVKLSAVQLAAIERVLRKTLKQHADELRQFLAGGQEQESSAVHVCG